MIRPPHVHIIDFKLDLCTCMCMRHLLVFEFNNDGMLKKKGGRGRGVIVRCGGRGRGVIVRSVEGGGGV